MTWQMHAMPTRRRFPLRELPWTTPARPQKVRPRAPPRQRRRRRRLRARLWPWLPAELQRQSASNATHGWEVVVPEAVGIPP
mmetsp:Transcript_65720/g.119877  ORF Transcript_65720/g.119877 Transcript_65720/m.119877 type:complete len:82 (+) Transcript_65720:396-641(+)